MYLLLNIKTTGVLEKFNELIGINSILINDEGKAIEVKSFRGKCNFPDRVNSDAFNVLNIKSIDELLIYPERKIFYDEVVKYLDIITNDGKNKLMIIGYIGQFEKNFIHALFHEFNGNRGSDLYFKYFQDEYISLISLTYILNIQGKYKFTSYKLENVCKVLNIIESDVIDKSEGYRLKLLKKLFDLLNKSF